MLLLLAGLKLLVVPTIVTYLRSYFSVLFIHVAVNTSYNQKFEMCCSNSTIVPKNVAEKLQSL